MDSGGALFKTRIPQGGFEIERRKIKTPAGGSALAECLAPVWPDDDTSAVCPLAEQPCLHRVLAECHGPEGILRLANYYGLLTPAASGTAEAFSPEPLDVWHKEIRALRTCTAVWDAIAGNDQVELRRLLQHPKADVLKQGRDLLARKLAEKMAGARFELVIAPDGEQDQFVIRYRPMRLIDAIWQRFAEEIAGAITCAKCPAQKCGRWFPRSLGRSDRTYCSHACQMRFRRVVASGMKSGQGEHGSSN